MNHGQSTYTVTVTNNSNGVSVDYETETPMTLLVPEVAAEVIKDLVNTVRSYPPFLPPQAPTSFFLPSPTPSLSFYPYRFGS